MGLSITKSLIGRIKLLATLIVVPFVLGAACTPGTNQECVSAEAISYTKDIQKCVSGCTTGATGGLTDGSIGDCGYFPFQTVWYSFTTPPALTMMQLEINSAELGAAFVALLEGSCGSLTTVKCSQGINGSVSLKNIRLLGFTTYHIAVSSQDGTEGAFDLCLTIGEDASRCNTANSLTVRNTSLGSPAAGPFKTGEDVEFCYTISDYLNTSCTYLHSIIPSFGNGWSPSSFNADGSPRNVTQSLTTQGELFLLGDDPVCEYDPIGDWDWYADGVVTYKLNGNNPYNLFNGDPIGAGWSFLNSVDPSCSDYSNFLPACCTNPTTDPNLGFGDNDYPGCYQDPSYTWTVCFELTTEDPSNCATNNDCSVSIKTYGDGETGAFTNGGCRNDTPTEFAATLVCGSAPTVSALSNIEVCEDQTATFTINSNDPTANFFWESSTGESGYSNTNPGTFSAYFDTPGTYTYQVYASNGCVSPPQTVTIKVNRNIDVSIFQNPNPACEGEDVTLSAGASGGSGSYTYKWDDVLNSTGISITVDDPLRTSYNVTVSDGNCSSEQNVIVSFVTGGTATLSGSESICENETTQISVSFTGTGPWIVKFEDQLGNEYTETVSANPALLDVSPVASSTYILTEVIGANGCQSTLAGSATVDVEQGNTPRFSFETNYCETDPSFTLPTSSDNGVIGSWSPSSVDPSTVSGPTVSVSFTPDNDCDGSETITISISEAETPTFSIPSTLCENDPEYTLPTNSNNGIAGSWNVSSILPSSSAGTTVSIEFTPDDLDCTNKFISSVIVSSATQPDFTLPVELCSSDPRYTLPTVSDNGINGSWNIPSIDPSSTCGQTFNLEFTPSSGCANNYSSSIEVICEDIPSFNLTKDFCQSDSDYTLPSSSDNGFGGTWSVPTISPGSIVSGSVSSVFTPTDDCVASYTENFNVVSSADPIFTIDNTLCNTDSNILLPLNSNNGIAGTWSVPMIMPASGATSITSVFTPTVNCTNIYSITFTIADPTTLSFNLTTTFCSSDADYVLPTVSDQGISGSWSVSQINPSAIISGVVSSTFTPDVDCAREFTESFTVSPAVLSTFSLDNNMCSNEAAVTLPLVSENGVNGTWSIPVIDPAVSSSTITSIFTPTDNCAEIYTAIFSITSSDTPTFIFNTDMCSTDGPYLLSNTSMNGYSGTWDIPTIVPSSGASTISSIFTPNDDCVNSYTATFNITSGATPVFSIDNNLCTSDAAFTLSNLSDNGIAGTWSVPTINPAAVGTSVSSTFSPTAICDEAITINFSIAPSVTPTFSLPANLCSTDPDLVLPSSSDNGFAGSWSIPTIVTATAGSSISSVFTPTDDCIESFTAVFNITTGETPLFSIDNNLCTADAAFTLSNLSDNGIAGTWSVPTINPATAGTNVSSTFSPTAICNEAITINFSIAPSATPTFSLPASLCSTDPDLALPSSSDNSFSGSWSIPTIVASTAGASISSVFTPTDDCVESFTAMFNITTAETPLFSIDNNLCTADAAFTLPTTSDNGIAGTWSVPTINPATAGTSVSSTFSPTALCDEEITINFSITPSDTPTFSLPASLCETDADFVLPRTSNNNLTGSWNVASIVPSAQAGNTINLTFTPDGDCIENYTSSITVNAETIPSFSLTTVFCESDAVYTFPVVSDNGVNGNWAIPSIDPAAASSNTINNVFIPTDDCASSASIQITINNSEDPIFNIPTEICNKEGILVLPSNSENGISGTWNMTQLNPSNYNEESVNLIFTATSDCANDLSTSIFVNGDETPSFNIQTEFCDREAVFTLPTVSEEGFSGSWTVPVIDPSTIGASGIMSEFVPTDPTACIANLNVTFSLVASITPTFDLPLTLCSDDGMYTLPNSSLNGLTGTWTPVQIDPSTELGNDVAVNFVPDNSCATEFNTTISVAQSLTPSFDLPTDFCKTDPVYILATQSTNGIVGSWSLNEINPISITGNTVQAIFTADVESCTSTFEANFGIHQAPDLFYADQLEICETEAVDFAELNISDLNATSANISYHSSSPADGTNVISVNDFRPGATQTIYILASTTHCSEEYPVNIVVNPALSLESIQEINVCKGNSYTLSDLNIVELNGLSPVISYHDSSPADATNIINASDILIDNDLSIYILASANGCSVEMNVDFVTTDVPELSFSGNIALCSGDEWNPSTIIVDDLNSTGALISFHTTNTPDASNEIIGDILPANSMSIFAFAQNGNCEDVLEIPISVTPSPELSFGGQVVACQGTNLDLSSINIFDVNNTGAPWTFHSASPASATNELSSTVITPTADMSVFAFADNGGCQDEIEISIEVTNNLNAGDDNNEVICNNATDFYLNSLLSLDAQNGVWEETTNSGEFDVNSSLLNVQNINVGTYSFSYTVSSAGGSCPEDVANFTVEITEAPSAGEDAIIDYCAADDLSINIESLLGGSPDNSGSWSQTVGPALDISTINNVDFSTELNSNVYTFEYQIAATESCDAVSATVSINLNAAPKVSINPTSLSCEAAMNGSIEIANNESSDVLEYSFDNGMTWSSMNQYDDLEASTYNIDIRNQHGCIISESVNLQAAGTMSFTVSSVSCDEAGTPNTAADDFHIIEFEVQSQGMATTYNLFDNATLIGTYDYGTMYTININADGLNHILTAFDQDAMGCNTEHNLGILNDCATPAPCMITSTEVLNVSCDDMSTSSPNDDQFYFDLLVNGVNGSGQWILESNPTINGNYGTSVNFGPYDISNGDFSLELADANDLSCTTTVQVEAPQACSQACMFNVSSLVVNDCVDNGTPSANDDLFSVSFEISATSSAQVEIFLDNNSEGIFDYGTTITISGIPADGIDHVLSFVDTNDSACTHEFDVQQLPCSQDCLMSYSDLQIGDCEDSGTASTTDDVFSISFTTTSNNVTQFEVFVDGVSQSTYSYNTIVTIDNIPADGLNHNIVLQDLNSADCSERFDVSQNSCSATCDIQVMNIMEETCNNNNTADNNNDDIFAVNFETSSALTSQMEVFLDGLSQGIYNYNTIINLVNVPADGVGHTIMIVDLVDANCSTSFVVTQGACSQCNETAFFTNGNQLLLDCDLPFQTVEVQLSSNATQVWTGPNSNDFHSDVLNASFSESGIYNLNVTFENGCSAQLILDVIKNDEIPEAHAGANQTINCRTDIVTLNGSTDFVGNVSYNWYDESGDLISNDANPQIDQVGKYTLIIINEDTQCESAPSEVEVIEDKEEPNMDILASPIAFITCENEEVVIKPNGDLAGYEVVWTYNNLPSATNEFVVNEAGIIYVEITNTRNGCTQSSSIEIFEDTEMPFIQLNEPDTLNCKNDFVHISAVGSSEGDDFIYQWYDETFATIPMMGDNDLDVDQPGVYYLEIYNSFNGCSMMDSVIITEDREMPDVDAGTDAFLPCDGTPIEVRGSMLSQVQDYTSSWTDVNGSVIGTELAVTIETEGWYFFSLENMKNGCSSMDSIYIGEDPTKIEGLELDVQGAKCFGDTDAFINVVNVLTTDTDLMFQLDDEEPQANGMFENLTPGMHTIKVMTSSGCSYEQTIDVPETAELDLSFNITNNEVIVLGEEVQLMIDVNIPSSEIESIVWTNGESLSCIDCLDPTASPTEDTEYEVEITNIHGCVIRSSIKIAVKAEVNIYVPNAFSPNGDGNNDWFTVFDENQIEEVVHMSVYNRWGNQVFLAENIQANELEDGWDGNYNGDALMAGVYVYRIEILLINGEKTQLTGDVSIIR